MNPLANESPNPPVGVRVVSMRLAMLAYLSTTAFGCILVFYSVIFMRADFFAGAVIFGAIAWLSRSVLREREAVSMTVDTALEEDVFQTESEAVGDGHVDGLVKLLREWDEQERSRGTAKFDPWALQSTRTEIREAIHGDPDLERLFRSRG